MEIAFLLVTVFNMIALTVFHIANDNPPLAWVYLGATILYAGLAGNASNS